MLARRTPRYTAGSRRRTRVSSYLIYLVSFRALSLSPLALTSLSPSLSIRWRMHSAIPLSAVPFHSKLRNERSNFYFVFPYRYSLLRHHLGWNESVAYSTVMYITLCPLKHFLLHGCPTNNRAHLNWPFIWFFWTSNYILKNKVRKAYIISNSS